MQHRRRSHHHQQQQRFLFRVQKIDTHTYRICGWYAADTRRESGTLQLTNPPHKHTHTHTNRHTHQTRQSPAEPRDSMCVEWSDEKISDQRRQQPLELCVCVWHTCDHTACAHNLDDDYHLSLSPTRLYAKDRRFEYIIIRLLYYSVYDNMRTYGSRMTLNLYSWHGNNLDKIQSHNMLTIVAGWAGWWWCLWRDRSAILYF